MLDHTHSGFRAWSLRKAMEGLGTTDSVLIDILGTSSNSEIAAIRDSFSRQFQRDLEQDVASETSGDYKKLMVFLTQV